jgi:N-glycosylase/DNA lyase
LLLNGQDIDVEFSRGSVILHNLTDFHPEHIFECGQAFRWHLDRDGYTGVVGNKVLKVARRHGDIVLFPCGREDFMKIWIPYFNLSRDYRKVKTVLSQDLVLQTAIEFGWGLRILQQDEWETLISFIISSNNGIKRIRRIIENLSFRFGTPFEWEGKTYYSFPDAVRLAEATEKQLMECGAGYRAGYIIRTARKVVDGFPLEELRSMEYPQAKEMLMELPGVGPKVADCILLFSMGFGQAFPVDVWIKRIMVHFYPNDCRDVKAMQEFVWSRYGEFAGIAQQYLFFYGREMKIGIS